ncbi:hypothetical protein [Vreelandella sedimenti]|mgnify:CR=1 FL=1|uniref:hypothetical protein n=1 Tax=Vreelandella sedimenti TaxID=2729618 RepID=UPI0025795C3C|nr:hypothetical protein [Halomonas sp. UBA3173]|tara:strand:+ start:55225 stop:55638 length:414 start_codon:yes stop_codon:yes gene_type:complete
MTKRVENQQITETIPVHGLLFGANIGTWQADYPLTALDFEHIKNGRPVTFNWATSILLATVGFGLNLIGKGASQAFGTQHTIYVGEWIALSVGVFFAVVLYGIGLALPNERKRVMKEIQDHFKNSPKQRQVVPGESE